MQMVDFEKREEMDVPENAASYGVVPGPLPIPAPKMRVLSSRSGTHRGVLFQLQRWLTRRQLAAL